jgi:hypothetical protein
MYLFCLLYKLGRNHIEVDVKEAGTGLLRGVSVTSPFGMRMVMRGYGCHGTQHEAYEAFDVVRHMSECGIYWNEHNRNTSIWDMDEV